MNRIKPEKTYCVQIRESVKPYIEREQKRFYAENKLIIPAADVISKALIDYFKAKELQNDTDRVLKENPVQFVKRKPSKKKRIEAGGWEFLYSEVRAFNFYEAGLTAKEVSKKKDIDLAYTTVKDAFRLVPQKMGVKDKHEAFTKMLELGLINERNKAKAIESTS